MPNLADLARARQGDLAARHPARGAGQGYRGKVKIAARFMTPKPKPARTPEQKAAAAKAAMLKRNADGIFRGARSGTCRRCHRAVFTGLDDDMCAFAATVDPAPLSAAGEVLALMTGRITYSLTWYSGRGRYEIDRRDHYAIAGCPPGDKANVDVVVGHECNRPALPRLSTMIKRNTRTVTPIDPPF